MAKLCPRGKAAAKRKFKVYPSAYANMYASAVCSGKVTPGGKKKNRKKAMGGGSMNTRIGLKHGSYEQVPPSKGFSKYVTKQEQKKIDAANKEANEESKKTTTKSRMADQARRAAMGGGMMTMPRAMYKSGGGACKLAKKGKGRAYGKNS
jgi:hypothetical protein